MPQVTGGSSVGSSAQIANGIILNEDINAAAAIARSKLDFGAGLVNNDIAAAAAIDRSKINGAAASGANNDITSLAGLTTPLSVEQGGTEAATLDDHFVLVGSGVAAITPITPDTAGKVLTSNGVAADPSFQAIPVSSDIQGMGARANSLVKTYFNTILHFNLWTGSTNGALTTDFINWIRSSTDASAAPGGALVNFIGTANDSICIDFWNFLMNFNMSNTIIIDFWAKLPAAGSAGDLNMGFGRIAAAGFEAAYNDSGNNRLSFTQRGSTGVLYATAAKAGVGVTNTDISAGITQTNWNNYRIEFQLGVEAKFYINGSLKATLSGANLPNPNAEVAIGFGRSNTSLFIVTAPNLAVSLA